MSSVKNAVVVILLIGVSYGAFQVINAPDPTIIEEVEALDIQIGPRIDADFDNAPSMVGLSPPAGMQTNEAAPPLKPEMVPPILEHNAPIAENTGPQTMTNDSDPVALNDIQPPTAQQIRLAPPNPKSADTTNSIAVSESGQFPGQFNGAPKTKLQPITPKSQPAFETETGANEKIAGDPPLQMNPISDNAISAVTPNSSARADVDRNKNPTPNLSGGGAATQTTGIDWQMINDLVSANQPQQGLRELSRAYHMDLPQEQRMQMIQWLDALAGKVIYSTEHYLEKDPYIVQANDTLQSIAGDWKVPAELVYNINRSKIGDPSMLVEGTELKVIRGPFNAEVSTQRQELTLFLNGMYAGRFAVQIGKDQSLTLGQFEIKHKQPGGRDYRDALGQTIPAGNPNNPYGKYWIGLDGNLCIHDSNGESTANDSRGCIRLSNRDAADVYGILSEESQVTITR